MRISSLIVCAALLAAASPVAVAGAQERYALLVGVGEYPNLGEQLQLLGPPNDVALLHEYLTNVGGFADDNVVTLTDDGPRSPRRRDILAALEELRGTLTADDFVMLYFAGHGSRQPADPGTAEELDGYDEIFLPADVNGWNTDIDAVQNAIVDDEIAQFISSYRQMGADVWAVFDSCNSGTMTRGAGDTGVRTRRVHPADLGVPDASGQTTEDSDIPFLDISSEPSPRDTGSLVSFFASHAAEETPEMPLPRGAEESEQRVYGLFTYSLLNALRRHPNASYAELAELVIAEYASILHMRSTPQFYGTNMDQVVFGGGERPTVFRAAMARDEPTQLSVAAGRLRGFDVGAGVSIHGGPADDDTIGVGTVTSARLGESTVTAEWSPAASVAGASTPVWVRLVHPAYSPTVFISRLETRHDSDNRVLTDVLDSLRQDDMELVEFRSSDIDADYFAAVFDERFWLLRPNQLPPCSARRVTEDERRECERTHVPEQLFWSTPGDAGTLVRKAARARNLARLQAFSAAPPSLLLDVQIERQNTILGLAETDRVLQTGDRVFVSMSNEAVVDAWDVFFFYVDSTLAIQPLQRYGQSARVQAGYSGRLFLGTISNDTIGTESLVIIAEPARSGNEANYQFLAQDAYQQLETRGGPASPLQVVLEAVWEGDQDVGARAMKQGSSEDAHIKVFTWGVEP